MCFVKVYVEVIITVNSVVDGYLLRTPFKALDITIFCSKHQTFLKPETNLVECDWSVICFDH